MTRYERLHDLMDRRGVSAVVLRRPANFAWFTAGGDTRVDHIAPEGVADLIIDAGGERVLTTQHRSGTDQAFAWNPSITGAKAEETFVLTQSGPLVLTGGALGAPA